MDKLRFSLDVKCEDKSLLSGTERANQGDKASSGNDNELVKDSDSDDDKNRPDNNVVTAVLENINFELDCLRLVIYMFF